MTIGRFFAWFAFGLALIFSILSLGHFLQARGVFTGWFDIGPIYKSALKIFREELLSRVFPDWLVPFLDRIAHYFAHIIGALLAPFNIHWALRPDWKDIIVPLWLYFGRNALANTKAKDEQIVTRAYNASSDADRRRLPSLEVLIARAKRGRRIFVWVLAAWGVIAALLIATATGLTPATGSSLWSLGLFLAFFAVYESGSNALVATLVPYVGETWMQSFKHHFQRTQQNVVLGLAVSIVAIVAWWRNVQDIDGVLALLIFLYIMLLGLRDCLNPAMSMIGQSGSLQVKWGNLQERAQFQLGWSVLVVVFGVIAAVAAKI